MVMIDMMDLSVSRLSILPGTGQLCTPFFQAATRNRFFSPA